MASAVAFSIPRSAPFQLAVRPRMHLLSPSGFMVARLWPALPPPLRLDASLCGRLRRCSASVEAAAAAEDEATTADLEAAAEGGDGEADRENIQKLYVSNLPWDLSASDLEKLFGQSGVVKDVEIIKQKNGRSRGFAFVTMASEEEARTAVEKLDSYELSGRIIRVEYAKSFRKPPPPPSPPPPPTQVGIEEQYKIFVSNLAWKARSIHLREFFSENLNPLSSRVVFESPTGRSAGYGFVAFATREEAESAIAQLDGKELLGRPVRLKISQRTDNFSESESKEAEDQSN